MGDLDEALSLLATLDPVAMTPETRQAISRVYLKRAGRTAAEGDLDAAVADTEAALQFGIDSTLHASLEALLSERRLLGNSGAASVAEAPEQWIEQLRNGRVDLRRVHHAALSAYAAAAGNTSADVSQLWRLALACWAAVLASPGFWAQLVVNTGRGASSEEIAKTTQAKDEEIRKQLRDDGWAAAAGSTRYADLETAWGLELHVSGLLTEFLKSGAAVDGWPAGFVCGPIMIELMSGSSSSKAAVLALRSQLTQSDDSTAKALKRYLSPLGAQHRLLDEGRLNRAIEELERLAEWPEAKSLLSDALASKARELASARAWDEALSFFERAAAHGADLDRDRDMIAEVVEPASREILADDDPQNDSDALAVLERGLKLAPNHLEIQANLAATYLRLARRENNADHVEEAVRLVRQAVKHAPDDKETLHAAAVLCLNRAIEHAASDDAASLAIGVELAREAIGYDDSEDGHKVLSGLLGEQAAVAAAANERSRAISLMVESLAAHVEPDRPATEQHAREMLGTLQFNRAIKREELHDTAGALSLLLEASFYDPTDLVIALQLAMIQTEVGRHEEAVATLRAVRRARPSDATVIEQCGLGIANAAADLVGKNHVDRAVRILRESLMEFDGSGMRTVLVSALMKARRWDEATAGAREAYRLYPNSGEWRSRLSTALHNCGVEMANQERFDSAIQLLQESLGLTGEDVTRRMLAQSFAGRGVKRFVQGDRWSGKQDLQQAARLDPSDSTIRDLVKQVS